MTLVWAYMAGALTLVNPCVLPLLPIVLAASLQASRLGPVLLAAGLTLSFTAAGVGVYAFGHALGIDDLVVSRAAAVVMVLFGAVLLVPPAQSLLARLAGPLASSAGAGIDRAGVAGGGGQFLAGLLLGAVWSPCIGPTLGGAIGLAASGEGLVEATATMLVFGLGVSTVLVLLAYGSQEVLGARRARLAAWMRWAKPALGAMLVLVGAAVLLGLDRALEGWLLDRMPAWLQDLSVSV